MAFEYNITNHNWIPRAPQNCLGFHHGKILLLFQLFVPDPGANSVLPGLTTRVKSIVDGPYCVISPVSVKQTEPCGKTSTIPKKQHDDVIKWKHFPRYWPFVRGIHRWPVNSAHKGQWRRALMFSLICLWINCWVNNCEAGDLRCHRGHYGVTVMKRECYAWFLACAG